MYFNFFFRFKLLLDSGFFILKLHIYIFSFSEIFKNGGFDVIIGNPPYGAKLDKATHDYLNKTYIKGGSETVISFLKLSHDLLKENGEFGFIIPKA